MGAASGAAAPFEFNYGDRPVRTVLIEGEVWFVAADVCAILDISNSRDAVSRLDEADVGSTDVWSAANNRSYATKIVNESGLYALIFQSRKPEAKAFKRWVTTEVLPRIRRTGSYALAETSPPPRTVDVLVRQALELQAHQDRLDAQAAQLAIHHDAIGHLGQVVSAHNSRLAVIEGKTALWTCRGYAEQLGAPGVELRKLGGGGEDSDARPW